MNYPSHTARQIISLENKSVHLCTVFNFLLLTFFCSSNVYFITLESRDLSVHCCDNPCSLADTGCFKSKTDTKENVGNWVGKESNWELTCNQLHEMDPRMVSMIAH